MRGSASAWCNDYDTSYRLRLGCWRGTVSQLMHVRWLSEAAAPLSMLQQHIPEPIARSLEAVVSSHCCPPPPAAAAAGAAGCEGRSASTGSASAPSSRQPPTPPPGAARLRHQAHPRMGSLDLSLCRNPVMHGQASKGVSIMNRSARRRVDITAYGAGTLQQIGAGRDGHLDKSWLQPHTCCWSAGPEATRAAAAAVAAPP